MVQNAEGTFFDMSDFNFTINVIENGFAFETETFTTSNCQGGPLSYNFVPVAIGDFAGPIALSVANVPPGATAVLSSTEALPGEPVTLTLTPGSATPAGTYTFSVTGVGAGFENSIQFAADVIANEPIPATPAIPENGAVGVDVNTTLSWTANAGPTETYSLEVATDAAFTNVVFAASGLSANETFVSGLESATQYFWRLHNTSACGASQPGEAFSFTTFVCTATAATGEAQNIPTGIESAAVSAISITQEGTVGAVKVKDVQGVHPNISDLLFRLRSPMGTVVDLASGYCGLAVTLFGNQTIAVSNPPSVAGTYAASLPAGFGPGIGAQGLSGIAVLANDGGAADQLCDPAINAAALNGKIALAFRGGCNFVTKVLNAQNAGAIAAIIINNQGTGVINMGGTSNQINIPAVMIGQADGQALLAAIGANAANFNLSFDDWAPGAAVTCPATTGNTYQPAGALSTLVGEEAAGDWLLEVVNLSGQTQGTLQGWSLELCYQSVLSTTQAAALPQVKAWPNPTGSDLHIGAGLPISLIEVSDPAGRVVLRKSAFGESRTLLPMAALGNGLYLVTLRGDGWSRTLRVVKAE
jgi:subtilisin-like proprotein convertase family protein